MAGYTRQSTADIIPTATVRAAPINAEYNAIRDAFAASGGHKHDGTAGEGEYIPLIADLDALNKIQVDTTNNRFGVFVEVSSTSVEQVRFQDGAIVPVTDNDIDLGTSSLEFKDLYLDGTANIDSLVADTVDINAGNIDNTVIGATTPVAADFTTMNASGNATVGGTFGVTGLSTLATVDINGGNIDNTVIGATTPAAADFTTVNSTGAMIASGGFQGTLTGSVLGNTTVTTGTSAFNNVTVAGTLGVTGASTLSGNATVGGTLGITGTTTYSTLTGANITATGTVNFAGATVSNLGTVTTAALTGGTANNVVIGGTTPAAITGTTITANTGFTGNVTGDVTGDLTGNVTASTGSSTFNNVTVNGTLDVTSTRIQNVSDPTSPQDAATKAYVDSEISDLIGGAPDALNTLNELAEAMNDDADAFNTLNTAITNRLQLAGGTMTGAIAMGSNKITGLGTPTAAADATTKQYVDDQTTLAETHAAEALASATAAAASYDSFDDRYLGSKTTDPTVDNDGNALLTGALYFDSTNNIMKVYNGTEWASASSSVEGVKSNFYYTATSGQTAFTGSDDNSNTLVIDQTGLVNVFMNGVRLHEDDFTVSVSTDTVTLATGAATGDLIYIEVFGNFTGQSGAEVAITGGSITGLSALGVSGGNATFGDNDKAIFGAGSDLQIYHDGDHSYIADEGTGELRLEASSLIRMMGNNGETLAVFNENGAVSLRYDGSAKLATTSTGIDVTGTVTADGLTVDGDAVFSNGDTSVLNGDDFAKIQLKSVDGSTNSTGIMSEIADVALSNFDGASNNHELVIRTNNGLAATGTLRDRISIANNGDISFYEDTGTTAKFFWDASAESLGIGTSSPNSLLHISSAGSTVLNVEATGANDSRVRITAGNSNISYVEFADPDDVDTGEIRYEHATNNMQFRVSGNSEAMRIDSSGNLLVGTTDNVPGNGDTNTGVAIGGTGYIAASAGGTNALNLNRNTSDGDIAVFRKDGTTVGSILTEGSDICISGSATDHVGLRMALNTILPMKNGAITDAAVDLGQTGANYRFKDLYLSGGVYLGGTGAANKLDDYEEGTWTVVISGETSGSVTTSTNGKYVKVGDLVHVAFYLNESLDLTSIDGVVNISLPFTATNWHGGGTITYANNFLAGSDEIDKSIYVRPLGSELRLIKGSSTSWLYHTDIVSASGNKTMMLHATFET